MSFAAPMPAGAAFACRIRPKPEPPPNVDVRLERSPLSFAALVALPVWWLVRLLTLGRLGWPEGRPQPKPRPPWPNGCGYVKPGACMPPLPLPNQISVPTPGLAAATLASNRYAGARTPDSHIDPITGLLNTYQ